MEDVTIMAVLVGLVMGTCVGALVGYQIGREDGSRHETITHRRLMADDRHYDLRVLANTLDDWFADQIRQAVRARHPQWRQPPIESLRLWHGRIRDVLSRQDDPPDRRAASDVAGHGGAA